MKLTIEKLSFGPAAIAHDESGRVIFVDGAVPDDTVEAEIYKEEKRCAFASVKEILEKGPHHVSAPCPLVDICGGCPWGNVVHEMQLQTKEQNVKDALIKNAHLDPAVVDELVAPITASKDPWGYRNKIELTFNRGAKKLQLGMHTLPPQNFVEVPQCPLLPKPYQDLPHKIRGALAYALGAEERPFHRIGIRASARTNNVEISLWGPPSPLNRNRVAQTLADATSATSIVRCLTKGTDKKRLVSKLEVLAGKGFWEEAFGPYRMRFSAPSFAQANTEGAEKLIQTLTHTLAGAPSSEEVPPNGTAFDLYAGAGTFSFPLAATFEEVEAVESSSYAVRDLRRNTKINGVENVFITGGDATKEFPDLAAPDCILVDPPRSGLTQNLIEKISDSGASTFTYISCNPQTLARDMARLAEINAYRPTSVHPFEMFAQTYHAETIAFFSRNS